MNHHHHHHYHHHHHHSHAARALKPFFITGLFIFSITTIILTAVSYSRIHANIDYYNDLVENWQTGAIMDITIAENCPSGYEGGLNYTWPGTYVGCWCGDVNYFLKIVFDITQDLTYRECFWDEKKAGCVEIDPIPPQNITSWGQVNGKPQQICLKRSQENWAQNAIKSGRSCSNVRMKKCGTSPNNVFCTYEDKCPINNIKIVNVSVSGNDSSLASCVKENGCLVLEADSNSAQLLQYKRADSYDALPLVQFRINEYGMCKAKNVDNITPDRDEFYLMRSSRSTCDKEGDSLWNILDTTSEKELFDINGVLPLVKNISRYGYKVSNLSNYQWNLYSRSYIPWNIECRGEMDAVINFSEDLSDLETRQLLLLVYGSIVAVVLAIALPCLIFCKPMEMNHDTRDAMVIMWDYLPKLLFLVFIILTLKSSSALKNNFQGSSFENCSSPEISQMMNDLIGNVKVVHINNVIELILLIVVLVFNTIYFAVQCFI